MQLKNALKKTLHKGLAKQYKKQLHKNTISYEKYIAKMEWSFTRELEEQIDSSNEKVQMVFYPELDATFDLGDVTAEYLAFYPMDGVPSDFAKKAVYSYFEKNPECGFVYGDEDSIDEKQVRKNPYWKPDWSPTEYLDSFYIYGFFAIRKSVLREADFLCTGNWLKNIVHMCDNVLSRLGGFEKRETHIGKIGHIPYILFHRMNQTKRAGWQKLSTERTADKTAENLVSVVVLSKDNYPVLRSNLETIFRNEKSTAYEVILVDNGSEEDTKELLASYCNKHNITYIYEKCAFNFSYLCNLGAKAAKGNFLLFMNDDVEVSRRNFMEGMLAEAQKPYVGAVGCKLLYPGTTRIQHAGITNLPIGPMHKLQFEKDNKELYFGRNRKKINVLAVTAACLMIEKRKFDEVGGFPTDLAVAYNDVALCFALEKSGYYNACLNDISLYHHESLSRGADDSEEKLERLLKEQRRLYEMYPEFCGKDPYYSIRLAQDISDTRMEMKLVANEELWTESVSAQPIKKTYNFVENSAVFATIEWISLENNGMMISGYTFVTGLDNASFQRELWLLPKETGQVSYGVKLNRCLRMDVAKNVPNETNVELSGFSVRIDGKDLEPGQYNILIVQKERFGKLMLFKSTGRSIVIE